MTNQSENINELAAALAKAQGEYTPALKDSANPFFKSKYANLCSIVKACQEPLSKNGLSISQATNKDESGTWVLTTTLMHSSGQWLKSQTPIITIKPDIQSFGSASTYARRYAWASIAGVTTDEDDDGEGAMARDHCTNQKKQEYKQYDRKTAAQVVAESPELNTRNFINEEEKRDLINLITQCSQDFQDNVWKFLTDTKKISNYDEISPSLYANIKNKAMIEINSKVNLNEKNSL